MICFSHDLADTEYLFFTLSSSSLPSATTIIQKKKYNNTHIPLDWHFPIKNETAFYLHFSIKREISLKGKLAFHKFLCYWNFCIGELLFYSLRPFLYDVAVLFILMHRHYLYIMDINPLPLIYIANNFFHSLLCFQT